jgi:pyruvate dehydrogenase E1 component alpha subunit
MRAEPDLEQLYRQMCRIRHVERALADLWRAGLVSGEMHLGSGEEATVAGVLAHVEDGDALSVDYRSTPPFVARGVSLAALLHEVLGHEQGLDGGRGGHMHLLSPDHLAASTGIVGAPLPVACGLGLAAQQAGAGRVCVAFFGDGAVNEGMAMESLNLAAVWRLPVLFVCKDNRWAVTTRTRAVTGGGLARRARGLGLRVEHVDGTDVRAVWRASGRAVARARRGHGPTFLIADVERLEGHFLGDPLVRVATEARAFGAQVGPLTAAVREARGAPAPARARSLMGLTATIAAAALDRFRPRRDPLARARRLLPVEAAERIEAAARREVLAALAEAGVGTGIEGVDVGA